MPAEDLKGPFGDLSQNGHSKVSACAVGTSSAPILLSDANHFNSTNYQSRFVRLICDQDIFYYWSNIASAVVDDAAVDGTGRGTQGDKLPANTPREEYATGAYIIVKAAATGKLRISVVDR